MVKKEEEPHWTTLPPPWQVGYNHFRYRDIDTDMEGFADPEFFTPLTFDLVRLKTANKRINGWWTGSHWHGYRLFNVDEVVAWKRISDDYLDKDLSSLPSQSYISI